MKLLVLLSALSTAAFGNIPHLPLELSFEESKAIYASMDAGQRKGIKNTSIRTAIAGGDAGEAKKALQSVQPELQRGVAKGIMHKNTVARKISRLSARIKALA